MARFCPVCKLAYRAHDPGWQVHVAAGDGRHARGWPAGGYAVCHGCVSSEFPDTLHVLAADPPHPFADPASQPQAAYWCACCRNYARENDPIAHAYACIRILPEDLGARPDLPPRPAPGAVRICAECWALWAPVVQSRWERQGTIPPGLPLAALGLNMV